LGQLGRDRPRVEGATVRVSKAKVAAGLALFNEALCAKERTDFLR
jgi:hypothetical protein